MTIKLNHTIKVKKDNIDSINRKMEREVTKAFDINKETSIFRNSVINEAPRLFAKAEYDVTGKIGQKKGANMLDMSSSSEEKVQNTKVKKQKVINELEAELLGPNADILLKDDLNFDLMAKVKRFAVGDFDVKKRRDTREARKEVLKDDISDLSREEHNFNEKIEKIRAGDVNSDDASVSSFDSTASRVNFWKTIQPPSKKNEEDESRPSKIKMQSRFSIKDQMKKLRQQEVKSSFNENY